MLIPCICLSILLGIISIHIHKIVIIIEHKD